MPLLWEPPQPATTTISVGADSRKYHLERAVWISSKEFVRGFIIGQVALLLVLLALARFLFFRSPIPPTAITFSNRKNEKIKTRKGGDGNGLDTLAKQMGVNAEDLPKNETCTWANALVMSLLLEPPLKRFLDDKTSLKHLSAILNAAATSKTDMIGGIEVTKLHLGDNFPMVKWVSVVGEGCWQARLEWHDIATIDVDTMVILKLPTGPAIASLPCSFSLNLKSFEATLVVQLTKNSLVEVSTMGEDFLLDLEIHSLIGHRSKLKDVPKLTAILYSRIRQAISKYFLYPNKVSFPIPSPLQ